jgi:uncharacterized integral membrane protein (TIGR00698 family)
VSAAIRPSSGVAAGRPARPAACGLLLVGAFAALLPWTPPWAALLAGATLALTLGNPWAAGTARLARQLLPLAVVGLGAGVNLAVVARVGLHGLGYTLVGLGATFALGAWLARRLGVAARLAALVCAGTGICGGSAIAAAAPAVGAKTEEISAALATVFTLNAVALLVFPPLGTWIGLDPHQFGLWCALAIHDTSSVTGAALTHGAEALATATTVKLARALWIVPVALALGAWAARRDGTAGKAGRPVPWFIGGFVLLSALFTFTPTLQPGATWIIDVARALLTLTLFFIGAGLDRAAVVAVGLRPFALGGLLWIAVIAGSLGGILGGWIR